MTQALERYHEYVQVELAKGVSELDTFNKELIDKKEALHVEESVIVMLMCECS